MFTDESFATDITFPLFEWITNQADSESAATDPADFPPLAGALQPDPEVPHDPPGIGSKSAIQTGRCNAAPPASKQDKGDRIPGGWRTTRKEVVIAGRGWILQHAALDEEGQMDDEWAEEVLFTRADFFMSCCAAAEITGNDAMAMRIYARLARETRLRAERNWALGENVKNSHSGSLLQN